MTDEPTHSDLIKQGLAKAREKGRTLGRPRSDREPEIRKLLLAGWPQRRVQQHLSAGCKLVKRVNDQIREGK